MAVIKGGKNTDEKRSLGPTQREGGRFCMGKMHLNFFVRHSAEVKDTVMAEQRTCALFSPSLIEPGSRGRRVKVMRGQKRGGWRAGRNRRKGGIGWGMSENQCKYRRRKRKRRKQSQRHWQKHVGRKQGEEKKKRNGIKMFLKQSFEVECK